MRDLKQYFGLLLVVCSMVAHRHRLRSQPTSAPRSTTSAMPKGLRLGILPIDGKNFRTALSTSTNMRASVIAATSAAWVISEIRLCAQTALVVLLGNSTL